MINLQIDENPHLERFFQKPFYYTGVTIQLKSLQHFRSLLKFNQNIKIYWKHQKDNKKILIRANTNSYQIGLKQQSESQEQLQYQGWLLSQTEGYSVQFGLKYHMENPLVKHTLTPSMQINFFGQSQPNLDFGLKYNYVDAKDGIYIRAQCDFQPSSLQFIDYCLVGNFMKEQKLQVGLKNHILWLGNILNYNRFNVNSYLNYDLNNKYWALSSYLQYDGKQKIFDRLKWIAGISTEKEVLGQIRFLTKQFEFGYCLKWQHAKGLTTGFNIEM